LGEIPKKYEDNNYAPNSPTEWERVSLNLILNGVFLVGGGIAVYLVVQLFKK
jgi:hypothetical protein